MDKKKRLMENLDNMRRLMLVNEDVNSNGENLPSSGDPNHILYEIKADYQKAVKYLDSEAAIILAGVTINNILNKSYNCSEKERELSKSHDYCDMRLSYYDNKIDEFHEDDRYGYSNEIVNEIERYIEGYGYISDDIEYISQVWYKMNEIAEGIFEMYDERKSKSIKRVKDRESLLKIKKV